METDEEMGEVFQSCPNLSDLRMRSCLATDRSLEGIAAYGANLRLLDLQQCSKITLKGLEAICKHCWKLVREILCVD